MNTLGVPRRIILINRYFYPDYAPTSELLSSLAFRLVRWGFHVEVITSRLQYNDAKAMLRPRETIQGVKVRRVWTSRRGRQNLFGRSLDYLSFYLFAGWELRRIAKPGDVIVAKTDPPLLSVVVAPIAKLKRARLVNWLQDIFPEVAERLAVGSTFGSFAFRVMKFKRNQSLKVADVNVVVGPGMVGRLLAEGVPRKQIRVIENWADGEFIVPVPPEKNELRESWGLNHRFVVGYAGNLGRVHDFQTIVDAMSEVQKRAISVSDDVAGRITFVFIGGGAQFPFLEREILKRGLRNVLMRPYQPRNLIAQTLSVADLHLVSLNPELEGFVVPSKFYGVAAAGRPMLYIGAGDSEMARRIQETGFGFAVTPGDEQMLMARILHLANDPALCLQMGKRARHAFEQRWEKKYAVAKWVEILNEMVRDQ